MGLQEFVSDPRFQSKDLRTKRAMLADYGVDESDFGPLLSYRPKAEAKPEATKSAAQAFVDRGIETAKGLGSLALDAGKSALTLEGQAKFLPRMAANLYEGAVQSGADAITRQQTPLRKAAAAVPFVGPYVMNAVSDIEEGKGSEVLGRTAFDALTLATPAKAGQVGRATVGAAKSAVPVAVDAAKAVGAAAIDPLTISLATTGASVGGQLAGPVGAVLGGGGVALLKIAPEVYKAVRAGLMARRGISGAQAEAVLMKMPTEELAATVQAVVEPAPAAAPVAAPAKASAEQVLQAQNAYKVQEKIRQGNPPQRAYSYEQAGLPVPPEVAAAEASRIRPIPPNKLPPVLPDPVVPEIAPAVEVITEAPKVRKPRAAKPKPEPAPAPAPEVTAPVAEVATVRPGTPGDNARTWMQKYAASDIEGRRALVKGLSGKLTYEDMRQLGAYTDDITTDGPLSTPKAVDIPALAKKVESEPTLDPIMMPAKNDAGVGPLNITAKLQDHPGYKELVEKVRGKSQEEALQILADAELKDWLIRPTMEMAGLEAPSAKAVRGAVERVKDRKWDEWQLTARDVGEGDVVTRPHPGQASPAFVNERLKYLQEQAAKRGDAPAKFAEQVAQNKTKGAELAAVLEGSKPIESLAMKNQGEALHAKAKARKKKKE